MRSPLPPGGEGQGEGVYTYIHGPGIDEPLARIDGSGAVAYYHADGLGSIVAMTDAALHAAAGRTNPLVNAIAAGGTGAANGSGCGCP